MRSDQARQVFSSPLGLVIGVQGGQQVAVADVTLIDLKQWLRRILQVLVDVVEFVLRYLACISEVNIVQVTVVINIDLLMVLGSEVEGFS